MLNTMLKAKPEVLAPAGDREKLRYAFAYGADAVYVGAEDFSLRTGANLPLSDLAEGLALAHAAGKRLYVALNIFATEADFAELPDRISALAALGVDALIVSDPGVLTLVRELAPDLPIHLSTQANCLNSRSALFWLEQGVSRIICAREMDAEALAAMSNAVSGKGETEIFVHGAMCMAYSGRCLLSNYLVGRAANRGACAQPCRYKYTLTEEQRPGLSYPIAEDENGAYILNAGDLCLLERLPDIARLGVSALKIEGRVKSLYYTALVTEIYREAVDSLWDGGEESFAAGLPRWLGELENVSHRPYTEGFWQGKPGAAAHNYIRSQPEPGCAFLGFVPCEPPPLWAEAEGYSMIELRSRLETGERLEVFQPGRRPLPFVLEDMRDAEAQPVRVAGRVREKYFLRVPGGLPPFSIIRSMKERG
jgi:putative protease